MSVHLLVLIPTGHGGVVSALATSSSSSKSAPYAHDEYIDTPTPPYRMIALDLDGTLLPSSHVPSEKTCDYLRQLDKRGVQIVIATGRGISTVFDTVRRLALENPIHVVCSNGARGIVIAIDPETGAIHYKQLFVIPVPEDTVRKAIQVSTNYGYVTQCYIEEEIYADPTLEHHYDITNRYMKITGCQTIYVKDNFESAIQQYGLPSKALVLCRKEELEEMVVTLRHEFEKENIIATIIPSQSAAVPENQMIYFVEILHPEVHKGHGLQRMCDYLDTPPQHVIAFGDGDNDIEFLQLAGRGIAMKNARDKLKQIADEIIDYSNNDDGVLKTLQQMEQHGLF